jgi:CrcB protein
MRRGCRCSSSLSRLQGTCAHSGFRFLKSIPFGVDHAFPILYLTGPFLHLGEGMKEFAVVFLGGGVGSALRYWLAGSVYRFVKPDFPYGTLVVNLGGCFAIGLLMALFEERFVVQPLLRLFVTIGILGGFTTFSTFSFETVELLRQGSTLSALINISVSLVGCLMAAFLGNVLGRLL